VVLEVDASVAGFSPDTDASPDAGAHDQHGRPKRRSRLHGAREALWRCSQGCGRL